MRFATLPKVSLAHLPTPLEEMSRLRAELGGPRLFVKRDDATGLALGGNKARKLEYIMGDALRAGADVVVTTGALQSNHARLTAAAAARLGLRAVLVLEGEPPCGAPAGNLLLDRILGAEVRFWNAGRSQDIDGELERVARELRDGGARPYVIPMGGSVPVGSVGYAFAALELLWQAARAGIDVDRVLVAAGSGGTQAGLLAGTRMIGAGWLVQGVSVGRPADELRQRIADLATETAALLGSGIRVREDEVHVLDGYVGDGYGEPTAAGLDAIRRVARAEGLVLDHVYTGKAMAGLLDLVAEGSIPRSETVVFVHTGGAPGLLGTERAAALLNDPPGRTGV